MIGWAVKNVPLRCVSTWQSLGEPAHFDLVELGPGRGTLMRDLLQVAAKFPPYACLRPWSAPREYTDTIRGT